MSSLKGKAIGLITDFTAVVEGSPRKLTGLPISEEKI
jgi:hypothetical protein